MKKSVLVMALALTVTPVLAADFVDDARVVSSTPVYERVSQPRQECWNETTQAPAPQQRSMGGALIGGVVGGLLGSQIGGGHGSTAATAAGAIAGTVIGDKVANPNSNRSVGGAVVGGVAGGLLGSQVGGGSGNKAATAAGAIAGTVVGDRVANPDQTQPVEVQRCRTIEESREVVRGYDVTYRYNGQNLSTRLPYALRPGTSIRVGVNVNVLEENRGRSDRHVDDGRDDRRDDYDYRYRDDRHDRRGYND
jgi:uncharacterized protein YcfJ